jgi:hypothetical protein
MNGNLGFYIIESMPFSLRLRGAAFFQFKFSQLCFILLSVFAVPVGLDSIIWRFYIIFVIWVEVEFTIVYFVFPETKGPTLEEIALIFDGKDGEQLAESWEALIWRRLKRRMMVLLLLLSGYSVLSKRPAIPLGSHSVP